MSERITDLNDLEIFDKEVLGTGYISQVKLARSRTTNQKFAVKVVK